jgi:guanosine-3',5'-bis(diphosphate) 3'-pyrophosphohydrolase
VRMVGAKVDGRIVPLNHEIKTGEIIEILTTNQPGHGPSRDWINIAVTNQAKTKIRTWFKRERRTENIETGKRDIERDFKRNGIVLPEEEMLDFLTTIAHRQHCPTLDDFYAAIGYGGILISKIMPRIKEEYNKLVKAINPPEPETLVQTEHKHSSDGVVIDGIDNCLIKFSKCCAPLPGDEIIGFITRGHGVSIHKRDCNNVPKNILESEEPERWVNAHWSGNYKETFTSTLQVTGIDRDGFLVDVTSALYNMHVAIHAVNARQVKGGNCVILVTMRIENLEHFNSIMTRLSKLHGVFSVERINQ